MTSPWSKAQPDFDTDAQRSTPYADAVRAYANSNHERLMVPGHGKTLTGSARALDEFFGGNLVSYDIPAMIEGIDLGVDTPYQASLELAAEAWGAKRTWFIGGGASQANRMAAIAARSLGKYVLMQRSSHSSFTDGVLNAGLHPSFVFPNVDRVNGASHGVTPDMLEHALTNASEPITSIYVVSPSYFGATADIPGLAEVAHRHDAALIVDCAWGAHFGFHEKLPECPTRLGADVVITSTHKLAGSLTQSAMLHLADGPFTEQLLPALERAYMMTASTSPSALLMASLDIARSTMATDRDSITRSIEIAEDFRNRLRADERFAVLDDTFAEYDDIVATDALRVTADISKLGVTGHWVAGALERRGVYMEMATVTTVVAVIGAGAAPDLDFVMEQLHDVADEAQRLLEAGEDLPNPSESFPELPGIGSLLMLPRDAFFAHTEVVPAAKAVGRISADSLAAYPPGIPNVIPGEVITQELVDFLAAVAESPTGYVRGSVDPGVTQYRVLAE